MSAKKRENKLLNFPKRKSIFVLFLMLFFWIVSNSLAAVLTRPRFACYPQKITSYQSNIGSPSYKKRAIGDTFTTFPEWYIVYSARDYASFVKEDWPSNFRFAVATKQYWQSYECMLTLLTENRLPEGEGMRLVLNVIGTSFSVENTFRSMHENSLGKVSEILSFGNRSDEDEFSAQVLADYALMLNTVPWYEFPYFKTLGELWTKTPLFSVNLVRSLERKGYLSFEYTAKGFYGKAIRSATKASFDEPELETYLIVSNFSSEDFLGTDIKLIEDLGSGKYLISLPRYQAFLDSFQLLIQKDVEVEEIAGNASIMFSAFIDKDVKIENTLLQPVFEMEYVNDPELNRVAYITKVSNLKKAILLVEEYGGVIEHIYDY